MSYKNVIIIGASGNLGPAVLDAFLKHSSFNTTVLSRQGSSSTFPSGVKVIHADYDSLSSLQSAFEGQDAVVSLVASSAIPLQNKLIDAAIAAGVKRFIPSEFGCNTQDDRVLKVVPIFAPKVEVLNYLHSKESEISWTAFANGPFFDWGLRIQSLGLDAKTKTASVFDGGDVKFSATTLPQIGLAVVKALENPDLTKNQYVLLAGHTVTQNEIQAATEKATGSKYTVKHVNSKEVQAEGLAKLQKGDLSGIGQLLQAATLGKEGLGNNEQFGTWNEKLGLEKEDTEEIIRANLPEGA